MCGIVGFVSNEKNKEDVIKKMTSRMFHRGPDGEGYYTDSKIALGHRRLAIIDIENGKQPMVSKDGNLSLVYNGEIYNYKELKCELERKGHTFKSNCDAEILIHGYEQWGMDMPTKLRGMFAFAIWDKRKDTLFCVRDNFGIKPLYFYQNEEVFMFASEIKAFLEHPKFKKILNEKLLGSYLSFSFTPTFETLFKNVYCLKPGNSLIFHNNKISINKYYDVNFSEQNISFYEATSKIKEEMKNSIKYHKIGDVEIGTFLSSGVDSSYITSILKPNKTYSVGYSETKYSEVQCAKDLCNKLKIANISKIIEKEEYLRLVEKVLYYMDEPISDPSAISLYLLANLASKDVKVVLSGEGADEFFCGYNRYNELEMFKIYNKIPFFIRHSLSLLFEQLPECRGRNFIVRRGKKLEEEYVGVNKIFCEKEIKKVLKIKNTIKNEEITKEVFEKNRNKSDLIKMQSIDVKYWLARNILLKADKMTMANSIEARTPFIDKEVFKIASSLPKKCKISRENTKIALREVAKTYIPNDAYKKKKLGFPVPLRNWLKEDYFYQEIGKVFGQDFVKEIFNQDYIFILLNQHKNNQKDNYRKIWAIYCFIKWYEIFFRQ
ncbi:MAG: asparagine synthase (glutamine-hydrolyzing) [Clostridia bacterium]|nr:asparagine synthase (glutamine-hydrolyzing) [Clostridia bacterium]